MTEQLTDRERALSAQIDEQGGQLAAWRDRAIAAEARVAALEADAARWSAFRHAVVTEDESFLESLKNYPCLSTPATAAEIDAAIDAAMKDHHD